METAIDGEIYGTIGSKASLSKLQKHKQTAHAQTKDGQTFVICALPIATAIINLKSVVAHSTEHRYNERKQTAMHSVAVCLQHPPPIVQHIAAQGLSVVRKAPREKYGYTACKRCTVLHPLDSRHTLPVIHALYRNFSTSSITICWILDENRK